MDRLIFDPAHTNYRPIFGGLTGAAKISISRGVKGVCAMSGPEAGGLLFSFLVLCMLGLAVYGLFFG